MLFLTKSKETSKEKRVIRNLSVVPNEVEQLAPASRNDDIQMRRERQVVFKRLSEVSDEKREIRSE